MTGKVRIYNVFVQLIGAVAGVFESTFRNLPPRISATNLRNYAIGHKVVYKWVAKNSTGNKYALAMRVLAHALGTVTYRDSWGVVFDAEWVDRIYASNLADRMWSFYKLPFGFPGEIPAAAEGVPGELSGDFEIVLAYAPAYFGPVPAHDSSMFDSAFPCSLLGEDATIRLANMGGTVDTGIELVVSQVRCDTVCVQSRELPLPIPTEYRSEINLDNNNPFLSTGDARKLDQLFVMAEPITQGVNGPGSTAEITVDLDGLIQFQGQCNVLARGNENAGIGAPFQTMYKALEGIGDALFAGQMWEIFGPQQREKQTQGQATKRLEIRGLGQVETGHNSIVFSRRRYETPSQLAERWADREGLSADERRKILSGGKPIGAQRFRRTEAIGVPRQVASRKDRAE
jgi:hypothetical protein